MKKLKSKELIKLGTESTNNYSILSPKQLTRLQKQFNLRGPLGFVEAITGLLQEPSAIAPIIGRLGQSLFKGNMQEQFILELLEAQKKGKINEEYLKSEYGSKSFTDILALIDKEIIDPKKWAAIKTIFFASMKNDLINSQRSRAYYLMNICLELEAFDFEVLKVVFDIYKIKDHPYQNINSAGEWLNIVSDELGYDLPYFVEKSETNLISAGLLHDRTQGDRSGVRPGREFRLTPQGIAFCELITQK